MTVINISSKHKLIQHYSQEKVREKMDFNGMMSELQGVRVLVELK